MQDYLWGTKSADAVLGKEDEKTKKGMHHVTHTQFCV
jgi:hypothetical protein